MTSIVLAMLVALVLLVVTFTFGLGRGNWRRGKLRLIRRERSIRRRRLGPVLDRLRQIVAAAWTRPTRRTVAGQLRGLSDRVERMAVASSEFVRAQRELTRGLDRLQDISPPSPPPPTGGPRGRDRAPDTGRGWLTAALLLLAAVAAAAANVWLLSELVLPHLSAPLVVQQTITVPVAASSLAFLLGLAYFTLTGLDGVLGGTSRGLVSLLVILLSLAEGAAVVSALEGAGVVVLTWWGGMAVGGLLGLAGALVPAITAALAHSSLARLEHWSATRNARAARQALSRQHDQSAEVGDTLQFLESRIASLRSELKAINAEAAGPLLLQGPNASVERTTLVLRRLATAVEANRASDVAPTRGAGAVLRLLGDLALLGIWGVAAASAIALVVPASGQVRVEGGVSWLATAAVAGTGLLLVGGLALRWVVSRSRAEGRRTLPGTLVMLTGLAAAAAAAALGPAAARAGVVDVGPLEAAAWVILPVLVAAAASARLPEAITAAGAIVRSLLATVLWVLVALADVVLAGLDILLTGGRSGGGRRGLPGPPSPDLGPGRQAS